MSLIQDRITVYSIEAETILNDKGLSVTAMTRTVHAQWIVNSGEAPIFPAWVRHGIETRGWSYERDEGSHIILDYAPAAEGMAEIIEALPDAPDFTPDR